MILVVFLTFPADTVYQAREQGISWRMILACLHPARRRERYCAGQMCTAASAVYCSSCCWWCAAATAASTAATAERV